MARLIGLMGTVSRDRDTLDALHLVFAFAALAESLADLREAQDRLHQAQAARHAAGRLRAYRSPAGTTEMTETTGMGAASTRRARPSMSERSAPDRRGRR